MEDDVQRARRLRASWSANAAAWAGAVAGGAIESRRLVTDGAVIDAVLERRPRRVLDLGCGEGWLVRALAGHGIEALGIDAAAELVERARAGGGGRFRLADYDAVRAAPQRLGGPFDVVVANFALLEADLAGLLAALREVLAADGRLVVQTVHPRAAGGPYADGWREEDFGGFPGEWAPMPWYFRTLEGWVRLLEDAGYGLADLREPVHPETGRPVSLLLAAQPAEAR